MRICEQLLFYFGINYLPKDRILEEGVVNDFNRLISRTRNLLIILAGSPRSGKSWVSDNYIKRKARNTVSINPDDISLTFTKDPNKFKMGSIELSKARAEKMLSNRKDKPIFIYDSTGFDIGRIFSLATKAKQNNFSIFVVNVFAPLKETIERNQEADRKVDEDYLIKRWKTAQDNIKKIADKVNPDRYFIVMNSHGKQHWYEYKNNKISK